MSKGKWILMVLVLACLVISSGCQGGLRFAPTESQKKTAWLTHETARDIAREGAVVGSPAAKKIVEGTRSTVLYYGPPAEIPAPEEFSTSSSQAQIDSAERPDAFALADSGMELGIAVLSLIGGAGGISLASKLSKWRTKGQTLEQIIKNNELFKKGLDPQLKQQFAACQRNEQTPKQETIIAEIKAQNHKATAEPPVVKPVA